MIIQDQSKIIKNAQRAFYSQFGPVLKQHRQTTLLVPSLAETAVIRR